MIRFFAAIKPRCCFEIEVICHTGTGYTEDVGTIDSVQLEKNDKGKPKQFFS